MATEEQKKVNQVRLVGMTLRGVALGTWDLIGETALAFSLPIGEQTLKVMEKEMGLEIAGEKAEDVLIEIGRLFVDEFGFCESADVEVDGDTITMIVNKCLMTTLTGKLIDDGVDPFICPYRNAGLAALKRLGVKARTHVDFKEGRGSIITFTKA